MVREHQQGQTHQPVQLIVQQQLMVRVSLTPVHILANLQQIIQLAVMQVVT